MVGKLRVRHMAATTLAWLGFLGPSSGDNRMRRLRLMLRHAGLLSACVMFLAIGAVGAVFWLASRPTSLAIAVGPPNSDDVKMVQAIAQQLTRDRATVRLVPIVTDGLVQSAAAVEKRQAQLAIVRRDLGYPRNAGAVAVWRQSVMAFIVPAGGSAVLAAAKPEPASGGKAAAKPAAKAKPAKGKAAAAAKKDADKSDSSDKEDANKIERIEELAGKRIGVVGRGGDNVDLLNMILRQYDIPLDKVKVFSLDPDNLPSALRETPVDVIFAAGPVGSRFFSDAIAAGTKTATAKDKEVAPTFLPIGASESIAARLPAYESTEIKAGSFGGHKAQPEEDIETLGFNYYFVASRATPDNTVGELTKQLFAVRQSLVGDYPALAKLEKPDTDKDAGVPAHPGAAAFIDDDQKTFFDKYSDFIYLGVMLLSGLGSGAAWLASYSRADVRLRRTKTLEHLLELVGRARKAADVEAVTTLEAELDDLLARTVRQVERSEFDEPSLRAFSLAFEQVRGALVERRETLATAPAASVPQAPPASASEPEFLAAIPGPVTPFRAKG